MALAKRAAAEGVEASQIEAAMDSESPKAELTALLLARMASAPSPSDMSSSGQKPHFGSGGQAAVAAEPAPKPAASTKHIMLSYQVSKAPDLEAVYDSLCSGSHVQT